MTIAGLQKMTLLDYPGKVACTVFLQGCNFRCPFCHNSGLLQGPAEDEISLDSLLHFLDRRKGLLDGVCVTGGEPTLQRDLPHLLRQIKERGFLVKLDTNGSRPEVIKALAEEGLLDYVAMDVKNGPLRYAETVGCTAPQAALEESLSFLFTAGVDYELRTTVVRELHDETSILDMGRWLTSLSPDGRVKRLFLQFFTDRDSVLQAGLTPPDREEMERYQAILAPFAEQIFIRG
ncbi:MAG: anaerobic ribonucleoside-triphosphate reductase activating protein [Oscillospiraceae bacterium]|nr:anaerobic ribonucleoside-triphosphate reductase activating protein [Oscillospiraceae bacterium]